MNQYIKESVSRFLGWKLPADFAPDAGITFKPNANTDSPIELQYKHEPVGTNLFNDLQATAMLTHVAKPLLDRITELEAQLADAQQVNQWHPIETAPKDGQLIFLWNPKEPAVSKFGKWARHLETSHFCWTSPKNISYSNLPTHWMPLPAAPAIAAGKQA